MRWIAVLLALFLLGGCGYRPASHYTKSLLGTKIFGKVDISAEDPQYGIVLNDALREAIVGRFNASLAPIEEADSIIEITSAAYSVSGLQKDAKGFTILYRAAVTLTTRLTDVNRKTGTYDFPVEEESVLNESKRQEAIQYAAVKALDELTSQLAVQTVPKTKSPSLAK